MHIKAVKDNLDIDTDILHGIIFIAYLIPSRYHSIAP